MCLETWLGAVRNWTKDRYKDTYRKSGVMWVISTLTEPYQLSNGVEHQLVYYTYHGGAWMGYLILVRDQWRPAVSSCGHSWRKKLQLLLSVHTDLSFINTCSCCGGLIRTAPQRLIHLNAWSLVSETFWEGLERVVLLEEMNHWRRALKFQKPTPACVSQPAPCKSDVNFQFLLYHHAHLLPPSADMITMN